MANKTTFTQVSALSLAIAVLSGEKAVSDFPATDIAEVTEKLSGMVANLEKKRTSMSKAELEKAVATEKILTTIVDVLTTLDKPSTIAEIQTANEVLAMYTNQKMSAMLKKLVDGGKVEKLIEKKKAYFRIATK